jgi:predicted transcriptional regulator
MTMTTKCTNPKCNCDSCTCGDDCKCGAGLGELERRVMEILWEDPGRALSGRDVADMLPAYAYTTVATVLDRLAHKGFAHREMDGRAIQFAAARSRAAHTAVVMHDALGSTRDPDDALVRFAETLSSSEAEVVRRTLDELEGRKRTTAGD